MEFQQHMRSLRDGNTPLVLDRKFRVLNAIRSSLHYCLTCSHGIRLSTDTARGARAGIPSATTRRVRSQRTAQLSKNLLHFTALQDSFTIM